MANVKSLVRAPKIIEPRLFVGIEIDGVSQLVGRLQFVQTAQEFTASFQYDSTY